ncbi:MAG TPA: MBL fold metallo-hydrolase [Steroidobacteraceae bacterium]|jgi:glyoxylase-like metal-dependent hydrolase (beta-lactamase superfamily II)|nr:MBL fold metallo-hydrolase [Steroidobacteraceae bacterium]
MVSIRLRHAFTSLSALLLLATGSLSSFAAEPDSAGQIQKFSIGTLSAVALKDGALLEPNDGKSFVIGHSVAEVSAVLKAGGAPTDQIEFSIQPLLVHAGGRVLLFDTGAGSNFDKIAGRLPQSLAAAGEDAGSVTDIFISHAHGDHVGGLIDAKGNLAFPNAAIHLSEAEWKSLSNLSEADANKVGISNVTALVAAIRPKVMTFKPGAVLLPDVVKAVDIKGHTPGHSGYLIGSGNNTLLFIGDALHNYVLSVRRPTWQITFDENKKVAEASRVALLARVAASGQRLYAGHFPFPGIGKIEHKKSGYVWVAEF